MVYAWTGKDYFRGINRDHKGAILFDTKNIVESNWMEFVDLLSTDTAYKILKGEADIEEVHTKAFALAEKIGNPNLIADIILRKDILERCIAENKDIKAYISEIYPPLTQAF